MDRKDQPKVAIILVNFNGAMDTIECLESIRDSEYHNIVNIVVDNSSTDNSATILKRYEEQLDFVLIEAEENKGFSAGNNIGINYALNIGVNFILLLNNDTIVTKDFLSQLLIAYYCKEEKSAITGTIYYAKDRSRIWFAGGGFNRYLARAVHYLQDQVNVDLPSTIKEISFITGCELLIPVAAINDVGYLDEDYFLYEEDADYSLRLMQAGYKLYYAPLSVIFHKVSASTSKISKATQYYMVRNRRLLIFRRLRLLEIITSSMFSQGQALKRLFDGRLCFKSLFLGIYDYYCGNLGKTNRMF